jgi:translation elongation factor EF-Tu-like GTPase
MQPLMTIEGVIRIPGRLPAVLGMLTGGGVQVGQPLVLRLGGIERAAVVVTLCCGFERMPPRRARRGDTVAIWLRGDGLDVVRDGEAWQVVGIESADEHADALSDLN